MAMYNLLEFSENYSVTSGGFRSYDRDEINDNANEINAANNGIKNNKTTIGKYFEHKPKLIGNIPDDSNILDVKVVVLLKYLSNFWGSLDFPLINYEIKLDLWSKKCRITLVSIHL